MLSAYLIQPAGAIRRHIARLPDEGGVYALLLDDPQALQPALDRAQLKLDPLRLGKRAILYLGASDDSLRRRLKCHLSDDSYRSPFRMSLGAVLSEELGLIPRPSSHPRAFGFEAESERKLSKWIEAHVSVAVRAAPHALVEEKALIATRAPLLNIAGRPRNPETETLVLLRQRVRGLPLDRRVLN